jgi:Uma2 family endonuclease
VPSKKEKAMSTVPRPVRRSEKPAAQAGALTVVTDRFSLVIPPEAHTMEGFREWATDDNFPERVRVTFLQGEIILDMSNEEINAHVAVKTEMVRALDGLVREQRLGKFYGDGVLLTNVAAEVSNNPDALFLSRETLETARARHVPQRGAEHLYRELEGTPDWLLEAISDSSVQKDTVRLRDAYHRASIPEYWLVDARGEELSFQILLRRKNGYAAAPVKDGWQRSKVFARSFRLERVLDDFGLWEYTLHVRED